MRIDAANSLTGTMTPHMARAYGLQPMRAAMPMTPASHAAPTMQAESVHRLPGPAQALVAGRVDRPIEFDGVSVPRSNPAVLNLYTRAADRIEAATAVLLGRTIDVTG